MTALLRLEAVNLAHTIDDTEDLATRRGGGYMLLRAVHKVAERFNGDLAPIGTGASIGLFAILHGHDAQALRDKVAHYLREVSPFRHATFVVAIADDPDFPRGVERCVAGNRWQQMQSLGFATRWGTATQVCATDEIRPAASPHRHAGQAASLSVAARARGRAGGRNLRQSFYATELKLAQDTAARYRFTDDFETLAAFPPDAPDYAGLSPNLDAKIAVFYADGNSFGAIQRTCTTPQALHAWDTEIKQRRRQLLQGLLDWLAATPQARTADGALRLETLLWGGDELLFVLPAWLGLEFARRFFALSAGWAHGGHALTHAAGLVFAHRGAPIRHLQHLAKDLAQRAKDDGDKHRNTLAWVVLESFDTTGDELDTHWQKCGIPGDGWRTLRLDEPRLDILAEIEALKPLLPRSALIRSLRSLAAGRGGDELTLLQNAYASTHEALDATGRATLARFWQAFDATWQAQPSEPRTTDAAPLTALLTLWDYLLPPAPMTLTAEAPHA